MTELTPYIMFDKKCAEAMTFYHECVGGELTITKVGDSPAKEHMPPETYDSVMHSALKMGDKWFLFASDMMDSNTAIQGTTVSLCLTGTVAEIKAAWAKLAVGGKVEQELKEEFFGTFGSLKDKYGTPWMFEADAVPQK